jgi:hypothetical protein
VQEEPERAAVGDRREVQPAVGGERFTRSDAADGTAAVEEDQLGVPLGVDAELQWGFGMGGGPAIFPQPRLRNCGLGMRTESSRVKCVRGNVLRASMWVAERPGSV